MLRVGGASKIVVKLLFTFLFPIRRFLMGKLYNYQCASVKENCAPWWSQLGGEGGIKSGMQCSGPSSSTLRRRRTKFELALNQMRDGVGGGGREGQAAT